MTAGDKLFWVWLSEALGAASRDFRRLIGLYESPYDLFHAEEAEIERIEGLSPRTVEALANKDLEHASSILKSCERLNVGILPYGDMAFPRALRELERPPVLLYYCGTLPDFNERLCIGMVGTRRMSAYGLRSAYRFSYELALTDAVVVSGMAAGIDGVCAAAALAAKGTTVAVLGCGVDVVYPRHHAVLKDEIVRRGVLISEYPPGTRPNHYHFPTRNRLISGLSQGTVVVEAGLGSGSLITAKDAILQGRDVFAIPANVGSEGAAGTNGLLRDGANLALSVKDILDRYQYVYADALHIERLQKISSDAPSVDYEYLERMGVIELTRKAEQGTAVGAAPAREAPRKKSAAKAASERTATKTKSPDKQAAARDLPSAPKTAREKTPDEVLSSLPSIQRTILEAMPDDRAVTVDSLTGLGYSYEDMIAALTMLEILGLIQKLPGALYMKT